MSLSWPGALAFPGQGKLGLLDVAKGVAVQGRELRLRRPGGLRPGAQGPAGEVDERVVSIHPVTLGDGVPLFPKGETRTAWRQRASKSWPNGLVQLTYDRASG
jgi:hypothetical protein